MTTEVYNLQGQRVGKLELPGNIFGVKWNPVLVHQALLAQLANRRNPWAHAKGRGEVRGGGRKPWRQKGTGRARHGSIRSPLWVGGGKAHGPIKSRDYSQKLNKKMRRLAILSVLSKKAKDGDIKFFDNLAINEPKTKVLFGYLRKLVSLPAKSKKLDVLIIPESDNANILRASRNLVKTKVLPTANLNVYDLMNYKHIFMVQSAVAELEKRYSAK
ncbi:MAG: 50S ribosomal protein L4 [Patescibacteria group bacterium]